jgi:hypothetical protein
MDAPETRIYVGRLEAGRPEVYAVGSLDVEQLHPATAEFKWGTEPTAALELARVLLTDASGSEPPADICRRFSQQILSRVPEDGFALQRETINAWLRRVVAV